MPFSIMFDMAIMYLTRPFIHSEHVYPVLIILHTVLSTEVIGANYGEQNNYPHGAYSEGDRYKQDKSKLQGTLDNNRY